MIYTILLAVVIILFVILLSRKKYYVIPKKIWTFWDGEPPEIVKTCMDSWRKHCPGYQITLLNKESTPHINQYKRAHDMIQRYSDFVRIDVLSKEGGIWIDASTYLNGPLDWVHTGHEFVGFSMEPYEARDDWPGLENWFLAASPDSQFIKDWYEEFKKINDYEKIEDYLADVTNQGIDFTRLNGFYLVQHVAAQKCIQTKQYDISAMSAKQDAFRYLFDHEWDSKPAMEKACRGEYADQKIIKMRGNERPHATPDCFKDT